MSDPGGRRVRPLTGGDGMSDVQVLLPQMLEMDRHFSLKDGEQELRRRYMKSLENLQGGDFVDKADWLGESKAESLQHFRAHWVDEEGGQVYWPQGASTSVLDPIREGFRRAAWKGLGVQPEAGGPQPPPHLFDEERDAGMSPEELTGVLPRVTTWVPLSGYHGPVKVDAVRGVAAVQVVVFTPLKPKLA